MMIRENQNQPPIRGCVCVIVGRSGPIRAKLQLKRDGGPIVYVVYPACAGRAFGGRFNGICR